MARNKTSKQQTSDQQRSDNQSRWGTKPKLTWINPRLDASDREWLESHDNELPVVVCDFIDAIPETASLSSKYDADSTRYLSTLIFAPDDPRSPNVAISFRGASRLDSLYALAYLVGEKLAWDFGDTPTDENLGRWG